MLRAVNRVICAKPFSARHCLACMKITIIIGSIILVLAIVFQGWTYMSTKKTETQRYEVLESEGAFEIRFYPEAIMITSSRPNAGYKESSGSLFRTLAGYIFGGNQEQEKIAMTSPVHMSFQDSISSMSFVMPAEYKLEDLPKPAEGSDIDIHTTDSEILATLRFGGFTNDELLREKTEELKTMLEDRGISTAGDFRYLGYNPPYQIVGRRNEVVVPIQYQRS